MSQSGGCSALRVGGRAYIILGIDRRYAAAAAWSPAAAAAGDGFAGECSTHPSKQPDLAGHQIEEPDCDERPENGDVAGHHDGFRGPNHIYKKQHWQVRQRIVKRSGQQEPGETSK